MTYLNSSAAGEVRADGRGFVTIYLSAYIHVDWLYREIYGLGMFLLSPIGSGTRYEYESGKVSPANFKSRDTLSLLTNVLDN